MSIIEALASMGYRNIGQKVWAKPVAHSLFVYKIPSEAWYQLFIASKTGTLNIYDSKTVYDDDLFIDNIKNCERSANLQIGSWDSEFHFMSVKELIDLIL